MDRRALLGLAAGGLLVALLRRRAVPGGAQVWAADRGAGRVVGLDSDLRVRHVVPIPCPVALATLSTGARSRTTSPTGALCPTGVWVASSPHGTSRDPLSRLYLLDERGAVLATSEQAELRSMRCDARGRLWLLRGPRGSEELCAIDAGPRVDGVGECDATPRADDDEPCTEVFQELQVSVILGAPDALHFAVAPSGAWIVARRDGTLTVGNDAGEVLGACGARVRDVQPAAQGFWLLGDRGLQLVGEGLEPRAKEPLLERPGRLLPVVGGEAVWHLYENGRGARLYTLGSTRGVVSDLPLAGIRDGVGLADGGLMVVAPGAVLRVDEYGAFGAGQGGFRELSAIVVAPNA